MNTVEKEGDGIDQYILDEEQNKKEINTDINTNTNNLDNDKDQIILNDNEEKEIIPPSKIDVPYLEEYERAAKLFGGIQQFRQELSNNLADYDELLANNEKLFEDHGVEDPMPDDYIAVKNSLKKCYVTIRDNKKSLDEMRKALDEFKEAAFTYAGNHREFWRSHRSEESAQRHVIINGIRDLCIVHKTLFDKYKSELQKEIVKFHDAGKNFRVGNESPNTLKNVVRGARNREILSDQNMDSIKYYADLKIAEGKKQYPGVKEAAEQKMLYDRYGRKTGLKTEEKRNALEPLRGMNTAENYAKNYLSIKYLNAIKERDGIKGFIKVNEAIREKPFKKEAASLEDDFYFARIVDKYNNKDWVKKWSKVEQKSEKLLVELKAEERTIQSRIITTIMTLQPNKNILSDLSVDDMEENKVPGDNNIQDNNDIQDNKIRLDNENNPQGNLLNEEDRQKLKPVESELDKKLKPYIPVARLLLCKVLTRPENRPMLHAFADSPKALQKYVIRDYAEYIYNVDKLPSDGKKIQKYLESRVKDTSWHATLGRRIQNFYEEVVIPAQNNAAKKKAGKKSQDIIQNDNQKDLTILDENNNEIKTNNELNADLNNNKTAKGFNP